MDSFKKNQLLGAEFFPGKHNLKSMKEFIESKKEGVKEFIEAMKEDLNEFIDAKKENVKDFIELKKEEIKEFLQSKKEDINELRISKKQKEDLHQFIEIKEEQIKGFTGTKKEQIKEFIATKKEVVKEHLATKKESIYEYIVAKKEEIQEFMHHKINMQEIKEYTERKKDDIKEFIATRKEDIKEFVGTKKEDIKEVIITKKEAIQEFINIKKEDILDFMKFKDENTPDISGTTNEDEQSRKYTFEEFPKDKIEVKAEENKIEVKPEENKIEVKPEENKIEVKAEEDKIEVTLPKNPINDQPSVSNDSLGNMSEIHVSAGGKIDFTDILAQEQRNRVSKPIEIQKEIPEKNISPEDKEVSNTASAEVPTETPKAILAKDVVIPAQRVISSEITQENKKNIQKHILFAEDDLLLRKSLAFYLTDSGYKVSQAENGMEAVEQIKATRFDLMVIDLSMPFIGGMEIINMVHNELKLATPIIVLTSSGVEEVELESFTMGANEFISKPFSPPVLKARIDKLIAKFST